MKREERLFDKLDIINVFKLFNMFLRIRKTRDIKYIKVFIDEYYFLEQEMPNDFYQLLLNKVCGEDYFSIFMILLQRDIYSLISYLKYNQDHAFEFVDNLTSLQYYVIPRRYIDKIIDKLGKLENKINDNYLDILLKEEYRWLLKRNPRFTDSEYRLIAYKIYISIGLDNALELLSGKYGQIDYEKIYYLFSNLDIKTGIQGLDLQAFNNFLFDNKKDINNIVRQMLDGKFMELFLDFDYFYNNFSYFVSKLGRNMTKNKVKTLLEERYVAKNVAFPQITRDILDDMVSSYHCKYMFLDTSREEICQKNFDVYDSFLRSKYKSSIPMIDLKDNGQFLCELIKLSDPRNLVLGYRAGNCFRINGDASLLFHMFLQSEHMRLLSISTLENKDFAMMLIMRNGNVLIGQGIEVSKRASVQVKGRELYDTCRLVLKQLMEYMNSMGDEIVATVIGSTNSNVSDYNNHVLPFLISPILENSNNYYNGIDNYQCLLDISEGKSLQDIKLYEPTIRYFDKREVVLEKIDGVFGNYSEIEKRLTALRFLRMQNEGNTDFYHKLLSCKEIYTCCNVDWYITLFDDGSIDGFISGNDERALEEYHINYAKIRKNTQEYKRETDYLRKR